MTLTICSSPHSFCYSQLLGFLVEIWVKKYIHWQTVLNINVHQSCKLEKANEQGTFCGEGLYKEQYKLILEKKHNVEFCQRRWLL